ncbi:MAG: alcohol dehydrogenase catalytic domain-containing protein [Bryobacterales bacterium]|nr:alcohol dehydrogenase catalytic domain-containing protein [Bryobacteraceae bacterium]MDW8354173.1 alcohol dehydrogenase catalytic domain-containing protein [Bryobacterales bacterium]
MRMRAVGLDFANRRLGERMVPEPPWPGDGEVLLRVRYVGVCGTDRFLAFWEFGAPPPDSDFLILGHEALCEVVEAGRGVANLAPGDLVVPIVRRPCQPPCASCARGRRDLCLTGRYTERGIVGADGYFTEYALDRAEDLIFVPAELADVAILVEPLSVVEKAVETALRLHDDAPRTALVFGAGTIGILAALAFRERGLEVTVCSLEPEDHPRAGWLREAGFTYEQVPTRRTADIVLEAAGPAAAAFAAVRALAPLGVCGILGAASDAAGDFPFRSLLLGNQRVFGSVNASPDAFRRAVEDLARFDRRLLSRLIRRCRFEDYVETILGPAQPAPKPVHVVAEGR